MTKPKKHYVDGYDFFFWDYEEQTQMKHLVLVEYFKIWAHKLGSTTMRPCFFDCHGGCGAYVKDATPYWGSSILAANVANELLRDYHKKVDICVCESDPDNYRNLVKVSAHNKHQSAILISNEDFKGAVHKENARQYFLMHPTLFFVDPFGYSVDINDLAYLMKFKRCEVLFNFMYNFINRAVSIESEKAHMDALFGCRDWENAKALKTPIEREMYLVELFKRQIKSMSGAKYVFPYRLSFYDKNRTYYYLFHISNHYDGCSTMKSCFAGQNYGKVEYLGQRSGDITLFDLEEAKIGEVKQYLCRRYQNSSNAFSKICTDIIDDTLFLEKEIRAAIKELKKENQVTTTSVTSQTDRGLQGNDIVHFQEVK